MVATDGEFVGIKVGARLCSAVGKSLGKSVRASSIVALIDG